MSNSRFQFVHVRLHGLNRHRWSAHHELVAQGGFTLAYRFPSKDTIQVGYAFCSLEDNFNRKRGVQIAAGRSQGSNGFRADIHDIDPAFVGYINPDYAPLAAPLQAMQEPRIEQDSNGEYFLANGRESYLESCLLLDGFQNWLHFLNEGTVLALAVSGIGYAFDIADGKPRILEYPTKPLDISLETKILFK